MANSNPAFDPIKPHGHEQLLKLSCVTTWSFRRGSVRCGGLNWGLVSLPIKQHQPDISVKNHPPPPLCRCALILTSVLNKDANKSSLCRLRVATWGNHSCLGVWLCVCMCHTYPWCHCYSTNIQVLVCACVCCQHILCFGVPTPGGNWQAQASCLGLSQGGQLGCLHTEPQTSTHGECIEGSLVCLRINCVAKAKRPNKAMASEVICQAFGVLVFVSTNLHWVAGEKTHPNLKK